MVGTFRVQESREQNDSTRRTFNQIQKYVADTYVTLAYLQANYTPGLITAYFYEHTQAVAANVWTINHNMGVKPNIACFNAGEPVEGHVQHVSLNQATATFSQPLDGYATCS